MSAIASRFLKYQKEFEQHSIIQPETYRPTDRMIHTIPINPDNFRKILLPLRRPRCPSTIASTNMSGPGVKQCNKSENNVLGSRSDFSFVQRRPRMPSLIHAISNITISESNAVNDQEKSSSIKFFSNDRSTTTETYYGSTSLYQEALAKYKHYTKHYEDVQNLLEPLVTDLKLNQYRFELQKAVNLTVNSISPVSNELLLDKYRKLKNLLAGRPADGGKIAPYNHALGIIFIKDILAKQFLRQSEISTHSQVAALASVVVNLWLEYPDFGQIVMAYFHKHCPYLAPVFLSQTESQPDENYYRALGYNVNNGVVEKHEVFLSRMGNFMRFYAALLIVKPTNGKPNPLGLKEALRWVQIFLNLKPQPDLCAVLILELLQMIGSNLLSSCKINMKELLSFLSKTYLPKLKQEGNYSNLAYIARLETLVSSFIEKSKYTS